MRVVLFLVCCSTTGSSPASTLCCVETEEVLLNQSANAWKFLSTVEIMKNGRAATSSQARPTSMEDG